MLLAALPAAHGGRRRSARLLRGDAHNYIELALTYSAAGLYEDAVHILQAAPKPGEPLQHYYLYLFTGDEQELTLAESAPSLYCFPNRLEDITALEYAVSHGGQYAAYYLGCLLLDRSRWQPLAKPMRPKNALPPLSTMPKRTAMM